MAKIKNPTDSFVLKMKTLYDIEKQLEVALPKMAKAATNPDLIEGFNMHLEETKMHSERLEKIFEMIEEKPEKHPSEAIRGIIADAAAIIDTDAPAALKDAMLAGAGRTAEHFEMACYMTAIEEADYLDLSDAVDLLEETLEEEEAADDKLTIALKDNLEAAKEESEDETEEE